MPIAGGCAGAALAMFLRYLYGRERYKHRLVLEWKAMCDRVTNVIERLALIETHAIDYSTSMSGRGTRALYEIRTLLECAHNLTAFIKELLDTDDYIGLNMAERLLNGDFPKEEEDRAAIEMVTASHIPDDPNWEQQLEELLQSIGNDISIASRLKDALEGPNRRKRRGTMQHLELARIAIERDGFK